MLEVKIIFMQTRKEETQMHAKVQLVKIVKIIAAPSKIPLKQSQIGMENTIIFPINPKFKILSKNKEQKKLKLINSLIQKNWVNSFMKNN